MAENESELTPEQHFRLTELEPHQQLGAAIQAFGNACALEAKGDSESRVAVAVIQLGFKIARAASFAAAIDALTPGPKR